MAFRVDRFGTVKRFDKTPQGGVVAPSYLTRTGVFTYWVLDANGKSVPFRELRHPDEVFHEASLATLAGAPVTRGHPAEPVSPENWRNLTIGHVGDSVQKADEKYVAASVRVQDAAAVEDLQDGKLVEFSCGYNCDLVYEKGTYDGQEYDGRQTNIRYNHVAMGPRGWGRAGSEVRVRVDSLGISGDVSPYSGGMTLEEALAALKVATQRNDTLQGKLDAAEAHTKKVEQDLAAAVARADAAEKARNDAASPAAVDALVQKRLALVEGARKVLGADFKADGLPARAVHAAVIVKVDPAFKADDRSDDYLEARFDATVAAAASVAQANSTLAGVAAPIVGSDRNDQAYVPGQILSSALKAHDEYLASLRK